MRAWVRPTIALIIGAGVFVGGPVRPGDSSGRDGPAAAHPYRVFLPAVSRQVGLAATPTAAPITATPGPTAIATATATLVRAPSPPHDFTAEQLLSLELHSKAREADRSPLLALDAAANAAAQGQANDMAARGYFAHISPEGKTPWDWLREAGAAYGYAGQNLGLAEGSPTTESIQTLFDMMMAETPPDDGHRRNILNPVFRKLGIGTARSAGGKLYWVCDFTD